MDAKLNRDPVSENGDQDSTIIDESNESAQDNDPVSKRRTIRSHYREIENRITEGKDEIANANSDKFMEIMNEVENMHQHVNKPREQVADAEALLGLTSTLMASVKNHTRGGVTPAEFVSCLFREFAMQKVMKGHSVNSPNILWRNIGILVSPIFMNAPSCKTMIGPMQNELKQRRLTVRAKPTRSVGSARPEEVEKTADVLNDTDRNLHVMFEILKKAKKVKLENLLLNRDSFAQTVENLFALSFLAKDGRVCIEVNENGSHFVVPRNGPSAEEIKSGKAKCHQFIFRLDFSDWKLMKNMVSEGEELMPQRNEFCDSTSTQAKAEADNNGFSRSEAVQNDSQQAPTVKKFSRNYGRIMQNSDLTEVGDGNCKRKRTLL